MGKPRYWATLTDQTAYAAKSFAVYLSRDLTRELANSKSARELANSKSDQQYACGYEAIQFFSGAYLVIFIYPIGGYTWALIPEKKLLICPDISTANLAIMRDLESIFGEKRKKVFEHLQLEISMLSI